MTRLILQSEVLPAENSILRFNPFKTVSWFSLLAITVAMPGCAGTRHDMASTSDTAVFLLVVSDYTVDLYVDTVDGKPTEFGVFDQVTVDAGTRELEIRLEHQPAAGSSLLVGGIGNLLLRAGTNKTFRTSMTVDVLSGHEYRMIARSQGETLEIIVYDETDLREVVKQAFELKDGQFERLF